MGFMDKVKASAETLSQKAQETVAQGQAKVEELQVKRAADALLRDLGAAVYAAERQGGDPTQVAKALGDLDVHLNQHGPIDTTPNGPSQFAPSGATGAAGASGGSTPPTAPAGPPPTTPPPTTPPPPMTPPAASGGGTDAPPQVPPTVPPA